VVDKKKVCFMIPSLQAGGMERVMSELICYFAGSNRYELHLVLFGIKRDVFYSVPENVTIHRPEFQFNNKTRFLSTFKTLRFLRKTVTRIKPDVCLSFGEYWNNFVLLALYAKRIPVFVSDRAQPDKSLGKLHDMLRKILYRSARGIIAQTHFAKEFYTQLFPQTNIEVIGNPIRFIRAHGQEKQNIILTVGRLINSKNHDRLIRMFADMKRSDWKLIVVGGDAQRQNNFARLQQLVHSLNAEDRVELVGSQSDVDSFYGKSKIFALTSSSEGFPNVIGEAQSAGLGVVAFDCVAGPSEMISDGENGFLVPLHNYEDFQKKLERLMNENSLREGFGAHAQKTITRFSIESVGAQYEKFLMTSIK
jgi:GalNAc-alpha-(1->4)-GalNAc-alpha-(1->3)-diNAcBac-PP-undecaprenol alpha-1,4-N-acetyl-D-galactosaminyltransferase